MHKTKWLFFMTFTSMFLLSSCAALNTQTYQAPAPGFTNIKGWNYQPTWYNGTTGVEGTATAIDIDGQIGYPLTVGYPSASCITANGQTGTWNLSASVTSGALPPGLSLDTSNYQITGIPTARGHWIVEMNSGGLTCNGQSYMGFTQELRFHIKGSGEVVQ